jgi:hypothetical protein
VASTTPDLLTLSKMLKEMLVHKNLRTLCEVRGPFAAVLNRAQII